MAPPYPSKVGFLHLRGNSPRIHPSQRARSSLLAKSTLQNYSELPQTIVPARSRPANLKYAQVLQIVESAACAHGGGVVAADFAQRTLQVINEGSLTST